MLKGIFIGIGMWLLFNALVLVKIYYDWRFKK